MDDADISAKAELSQFAIEENLYGLGAVENLKGEILIMNSQLYISFMEIAGGDSILSIDNSFNKKACLFVFATVKNGKV